jgi:hypothetical protein
VVEQPLEAAKVVTEESSSLSDGTTEESDVEVTEKEAKIHTEIKRIEGKDFYYKKFIPILLTIIGSLLIIAFRGGSGFPSIIGAVKCSIKDWIVFALYLLFMGGVTLLSVHVVH